MLRVIAVDDEPPALAELVYLLRADPRIAAVEGLSGSTEALRYIHQVLDTDEALDAVFLDIHMPGLDGLDVARLLTRFARPPVIVFVTAHDGFAVEAFALKAVDYLLKPVRPERLAETVRRVAEAVEAARRERPADPAGPGGGTAGPGGGTAGPGGGTAGPGSGTPEPGSGTPEPGGGTPEPGSGTPERDRPRGGGTAAPARQTAGEGGGAAGALADEVIPVDMGGVTRFVRVADIRYVEAQGDYARLFTAKGAHLVRVPLGTLEERWGRHGFVRIHRSHLIASRYVEELRVDGGQMTVRIGTQVLQVSRRHTRELRDVLLRDTRGGAAPRAGSAPEPGSVPGSGAERAG